MKKTKNLILLILTIFSFTLVEHFAFNSTGSLFEPKTTTKESAELTTDQSAQEKDQEDPNLASKTLSSDHGTIVKFESAAQVDPFAKANNLNQSGLTQIDSNTYLINRPVDTMVATNGVRLYPNREFKATLTPNDSLFGNQWHLQKISSPSAWNISTGTNSTHKIAVIDTGFALNHQDLSSNWSTNTGESGDGKETNGIDDDGNGFVDDWRGWDFVCNDNTPQAGDSDCDSNPSSSIASHGTLTAGTAGAITNNAIGIASPDWSASIIPLQVLTDVGSGTTNNVASAIDYAVSQGASVISMSLGGTGTDAYLRERIDAAISAGVLVIASAGNCGNSATYVSNGCNYVGEMLEPAKYSPVLSVGATDSNDDRASFSSYGDSLDVVAPGVSIYSTAWNSGNQTAAYGSASGTSLAAPIVAGLASLLKSYVPQANTSELQALIKNGSQKVSGMGGQNFTNYYGFGRVNAAQSLSNTSYSVTSYAAYADSTKSAQSNLSDMSAGQTAWVTVTVTNTGTTTWQKSGSNPMRLGTEGPKDRHSRFYTSGWLSPNRAANLTEDSVAPGAVGTFEFPISVPAGGGTFNEGFNLVAEGLTWLPDVGMSISLTVKSSYSWAFAGQQAYTDSSKASVLDTSNLSPGQRAFFVVQARNTGTATWYKDGKYPARLATAQPFDRSSRFYDPTWFSTNRPATLIEDSVKPGETGTFEAYYQIPIGSGLTPEYLNPVIDGIAHMNEVGLYLPAVIKSNYSWAFAGQQAYTDSSKASIANLAALLPGQEFYFVVQARNTGTATWYKDGKHPVRLGTSRPFDRTNSLSYHTSWLSLNRSTSLNQTSIAPGEIGTFEGVYKAPIVAGDHKEYFQPVAENITWLNDVGLYIPINVLP